MAEVRSRASGMKSGTNQSSLMSSVSRFWQKSYAADYVGFAILATAYICIVTTAEPFHRMFSLDNINLQYPHAEVERVPVSWNIVYAAVLPLIVLMTWLTISQSSVHKSHVTILGLFISIALTIVITDTVKNAVGRPRPDLIARCKPRKDAPRNTLVPFTVCTETNRHTLHDGWRSFPSGHSSFAFSGLGYLAIFLAGQMHVFRPRTDLTRVLLALAPLAGATLIAISRCEDYRHDVYDVTTGSIVGMTLAYFSYRRYYPSLGSPLCDTPFPSRDETASRHEFGGARDEEAFVDHSGNFSANDSEDREEGVPLRSASQQRG